MTFISQHKQAVQKAMKKNSGLLFSHNELNISWLKRVGSRTRFQGQDVRCVVLRKAWAEEYQLTGMTDRDLDTVCRVREAELRSSNENEGYH